MLYYLGYYSCDLLLDQGRFAFLPAMNKMNYIISVITDTLERDLMVVSSSLTVMKGFMRGRKQKMDKRCVLKTFDSLYSKNKFVRAVGHLITKLELVLFLICRLKKNDTLVVYHSLALMGIVKIVKKMTRCNLIIEVEELYSDVYENEDLREKEIRFLQIADRYIMITELLNSQVNSANKPRIISHGTYKMIPRCADKFNDGKIHVVYAGTFNPVKGGACIAVDAAMFLDNSYVLHVLGRGTSVDTEIVRKRVEEVSSVTDCMIIFEGYKTGKEFDSLIQSCHIGLSTQQPNGKYNASSFPSKILMYMSNGVSVVSIRIPAVETSAVGNYIEYFDDPDPKCVADAIRRVPDALLNGAVTNKIIDELHERFIKELKQLLSF